MEPTAGQGASPQSAGELIVHNGRCAGTRRPLGTPLTFIGRAQGCDLRLNVEGIDDLHCLLAQGPSGLVLRDLGSAAGTQVNGETIVQTTLSDGDLITIGPFQFQVHLPRTKGATEGPPAPEIGEALRVQVAAVAAQQASLDEEEIRLGQRASALERQKEELDAHVDERRRKLQSLSDQAQTDRSALERERDECERHIGKLNRDLSQAQKELAEDQHKVQLERQRLVDLHRRLRHRYHRFWLAQRQAFQKKERALEAKGTRLDKKKGCLKDEEAVLGQKRLRTNADLELGRHQLNEGWSKFRQAAFRWKRRRGQERATVKVREQQVAMAEAALAAAQAACRREQSAWEERRQLLASEVQGLEQRALNQRQLLGEQQAERDRLDQQIEERRALLGALSSLTGLELPPVAELLPASSQLAVGVDVPGRNDGAACAAPERLRELEQHAGELADQRLHLLEHWQRLTLIQERWLAEHAQAASALEDWALRLHEFDQHLLQRERDHQESQRLVRDRQEGLVHLRHQLLAWRTRLKLKENSWDGERQQLVTEVRQREELAERQLQSLADLKHKWQQRRQQEMEQLRADRAALQALQQDYTRARVEMTQRIAALDHDQRVLAEKALVLEQYRQEFLHRANHSGANRRLERLRRRWLTQNAAAIRAAARERSNLAADLAALADRFQDLHARAAALDAAQAGLAEAQTAWEHQQTLADCGQARLEAELKQTEAQRALTEEQVSALREELERIARSLYDDPDPLGLEKAA